MLCRWLGFDFIPASLAVLSNCLKHYYDKNEAAALIGKIAVALRSFQGLHWFSNGPFVQVTLLTGPLSPFTRRYSNFLIATWCFFSFIELKASLGKISNPTEHLSWGHRPGGPRVLHLLHQWLWGCPLPRLPVLSADVQAGSGQPD